MSAPIGFATTREQRCRQEVNSLGAALDERLKALRLRIVANYTAVTPVPVHTLVRRLHVEVFDAANKMHEAETHWKV